MRIFEKFTGTYETVFGNLQIHRILFWKFTNIYETFGNVLVCMRLLFGNLHIHMSLLYGNVQRVDS